MLPFLGFHIRLSGSASGGIPIALVLVAIGVVILSILASYWTAQYAQRKGFPFAAIFFVCLVVSFPIVLLIVALAPRPEPPLGAMPAHWRKY